MMLTQQMLKRDCGKADSKTLKVKHKCKKNDDDKREISDVPLLEMVFLESAITVARDAWKGKLQGCQMPENQWSCQLLASER